MHTCPQTQACGLPLDAHMLPYAPEVRVLEDIFSSFTREIFPSLSKPSTRSTATTEITQLSNSLNIVNTSLTEDPIPVEDRLLDYLGSGLL